jgi:hypothetical protein
MTIRVIDISKNAFGRKLRPKQLAGLKLPASRRAHLIRIKFGTFGSEESDIFYINGLLFWQITLQFVES